MSQFVKTKLDVLTSATISEMRVNRSEYGADKLRDTEITIVMSKWIDNRPHTDQTIHYGVEIELTLAQAQALLPLLANAVNIGERLKDAQTHGMVIAYESDDFSNLSLKANPECEWCAGTGTTSVNDGHTFYSGDDWCDCVLKGALA